MPDFDRESLLQSLRATCRTSGQRETLHRWATDTAPPGSEDPVDAFAQLVDESPYALDDWLEALSAFHARLAESQPPQEAPTATMLGYLHCCTLTLAGTLNLPSLTDLLLSSLERYGFDAAQGI